MVNIVNDPFDPKQVSYKELNKQQYAYLDSKPDGVAWKDHYNHSAGTVEIQLNSGIGALLLRSVIANRREAYLREAKNISSVIAIANTLGYSARRPQNAKIRLKVTPNQNRTLSKFEVIGQIKGYDIVCMENTNILNNTVTTIDCVVGNLKTMELTTPDNQLNIFRFLNQNVSNDLRMFLSVGSTVTELPWSENISDLLEDKWVVITNPFTSIDLLYLNTKSGAVYTYTTGSLITVEYIEASNFEFVLTPSQVSFYYGSIFSYVSTPTDTDTQVLSNYEAMEDILSIKINAPLLFETQGRIRGREDFRKVFLLLGSGTLIDTNGRDVSPAYVELTYLKLDKSLLTTLEKTTYINKLIESANYGVLIETIRDPIEVNFTLKVKLKPYPNTDITNLINDVKEIFAFKHKDNEPPKENSREVRRELKLETILDLDQIEHEINNIENELTNVSPIQISRVELDVLTRVSSTNYVRGQFVKLPLSNSGKIYECVRSGMSVTSPPTFSITDGELVIEGLNPWQIGTYNIGDYVKSNNFAIPVIFRAITGGSTDLAEPTWNQTVGGQTFDNQITWEAVNPIDIPNFLVWKCQTETIRQIPLYWNNYMILSFGTNFEWLS